MKQLHVIAFILAVFLLSACSQSLTTGSLLVSSGSGTSSDNTSGDGDGEIIDPNASPELTVVNSNLSANLEDTDKVEISGTCNDLNRKKNRILVEVFGGENLTDNPYISNAISDRCLAANGVVTGNGTAVGDNCIWVSKGAGLVEVEGPVQRVFPQCNNGQFSFIIRLGANLSNNSLTTGRRYRVRAKLRTLDGQIADSAWFDQVYISRNLGAPTFTKLTASSSAYSCSLEMLPARFNQNITYTLSRTMTDISGAVGLSAALYSAPLNSTDPLTSNFVDNSSVPASGKRIIAGASYTYTLANFDVTSYADGFSYLLPVTTTSTPVTCAIDRPTIFQSAAPTNTSAGAGGTGPTCYFAYASLINPSLLDGTGNVTVRWAFSTVKGWSGADGSYSGALGGASNINVSTCNSSVCTATQGGDGLAADVTYYYAVQEVDQTTLGLPARGKWSAEVACKPPQ